MRKLTLFVFLALLLPSCKTITSIMHDGEVVARVGEHKLYLSDIENILPDFVSPEDSASFAQSYINSWAAELLYADLASAQLSAEELDVTEQMEDYRRSLLKYRYEQHYISDRLDTLVTENQIKNWYESHKDACQLEGPIVKARFVCVKADSKDKDKLLKLMSSEKYDVVVEADTLAATAALKYFDSSDTWMDAATLAREFGMDWRSMFALRNGDWIKYEPENRGELLAAYITDVKMSGDAPIEYCGSRIREFILSSRKHALISGLEQDLLKDALDNHKLVIY